MAMKQKGYFELEKWSLRMFVCFAVLGKCCANLIMPAHDCGINS